MRQQLFVDEEVSASQNATSRLITLFDRLNEHAVQYKITGDGTLQLDLLVTIEGEDFITQNIASGLTKTSGPDSNGKDIIPVRLKPCDVLKLKATETGGANSATITSYFVQK